MKFTRYVKDKINYILGFIIYNIIIIAYANVMKIDKNFIIVITIMSFMFFWVGLLVNYWKKNKYIKTIEKIMDNLDEKYLISEMIEKPRKQENLAYYNILKKANKSMLENVTKVRTNRQRI